VLVLAGSAIAQQLPPNTVVGRLGISPGPAQPIPLITLIGALGGIRTATISAGTGISLSGTCNSTSSINCTINNTAVGTGIPGSVLAAAACNGVTDDSSAFSTANTALGALGGTIAGPPGVCCLHSAIASTI